jgi:hypothetical protein
MPTATDSPPRRRSGTVLLLHFSHPVAGIIHFVDYAVDETAHLARLRAGRARTHQGSRRRRRRPHSGARRLSDLPSRRGRVPAGSRGHGLPDACSASL